RRPPEALIAQPSAPVDTVRGAMLLRAALPTVQKSATDLRRELEDMAALRAEIEAERRKLANATRAMEAERKRLETSAANRRRLVGRTEAEREKLAEAVGRMSSSANDLRDLLRQIEVEREAQRKAEEERRRQEEARRIAEAKRAAEEARRLAQMPQPQAKPAPRPERQVAAIPPVARSAPVTSSMAPPAGQRRSIEKAKGSLVLPVQGKIAHSYGERSDTGTLKGIRIAARDNAVVIAPFDGQVVYAGRFRGYGQILIIEHGDGYHTLLAGLGRIDSVSGQYLLAGEPIGSMSIDGDASPELYVELRRNGEPINPLPWLAASSANRISG
ncbi:MAG: peptidoglycan DD-metalloendopeptidase family protein, partial [Alphaproteobacteria bacterium]|nr:peptidoglycan DD-metalloendopeptidase family protein [Alphaproteobacteria bacterium]